MTISDPTPLDAEPLPLVVRDRPSPSWLLSAMFAAVGLAFIYLGLVHRERVPAAAGPLAVVGGLVALATGIFYAWRSPLSIVRIDREALTVTRVGLVGRHVERVAVFEIAHLAVERSVDSEGGAIARPVARLRSGHLVVLSLLWRHDVAAVAILVQRLAAAVRTTVEERP